MPRTATTSSVEARKIFAVSPNAGRSLVPLAPGIGGIVPAVFVVVGLPFVAAGIQRDLQILIACRGNVLDQFAGDALVPDMEAIAPRGHVVDGEAAVVPRLSEV